MTGAIACYAPGCREPVVGQCQGFPSGCGQFYCRTHSENRLCLECAGRAKIEAARRNINETVERYTALATTVKQPGGCAYSILIFTLVFICLAFVLPDPGRRQGLPEGNQLKSVLVTFGPIFLVTLLYVLARKSSVPNQVAKIEKNNPHFGAFYKQWLKHKQAADRKYLASELLGGLIAGVGGAVSGTVSGTADLIKQDIKDAEEDAKWRTRIDNMK